MSDKKKNADEFSATPDKADKKLAKDGKKASAPKKSDKNFLEKVKKFFREYKSEFKKISWPTFPEVLKNAGITLVVVLIIGIVIWLFDWGASSARNVLIDAAKGDTTVSDTDLPSESDVVGDDTIIVTPSDDTVSNGDN